MLPRFYKYRKELFSCKNLPNALSKVFGYMFLKNACCRSVENNDKEEAEDDDDDYLLGSGGGLSSIIIFEDVENGPHKDGKLFFSYADSVKDDLNMTKTKKNEDNSS